MKELKLRPVKDAFENAWEKRALVEEANEGQWMYMCSDERVDYFKNSFTRETVRVLY